MTEMAGSGSDAGMNPSVVTGGSTVGVATPDFNAAGYEDDDILINWQGKQTPFSEVTERIIEIKANDPERFNALDKLAEMNGENDILSALKLAGSDLNKATKDSLLFLRERAKNPTIMEIVADSSNGSSGPFSNTSTSISLSNESQAGTILDANFDEQMGRTASASEIQDFQKVLNEQQRANPSTTTQQGFTSGRNTTSTSTSTAQFDPTRFAREYASQQDGADERYAGQTFMDILDLAISKPNAISEMLGSVNG